MELQATSLEIAQESIHKVAQGKGGLLGKFFVRDPLFCINLEYKKFYCATLPYDVVARRFPFRRHPLSGSIDIIVDALMGKSAVREEPLVLETVQGEVFQNGLHDMDEAEAIQTASEYAKRIIFRMCKNLPVFGQGSAAFFFRPHWMAYYGDPGQARNPRYLPFEADGKSFRR